MHFVQFSPFFSYNSCWYYKPVIQHSLKEVWINDIIIIITIIIIIITSIILSNVLSQVFIVKCYSTHLGDKGMAKLRGWNRTLVHSMGLYQVNPAKNKASYSQKSNTIFGLLKTTKF